MLADKEGIFIGHIITLFILICVYNGVELFVLFLMLQITRINSELHVRH